MIVVDTNIITYLFVKGDYTQQAEQALKKNDVWIAPILWQSEFRNVLAFYMRAQDLAFDQALKIMNQAVDLLDGNEYEVTSLDVLQLANESGCSAYDCEFVALAKDLGIKLLTLDKKVLKAYPQYTVTLDKYILPK